MFEVTEELLLLATALIDRCRSDGSYLSAVGGVESDAAVCKPPLHILVVGWGYIQPKRRCAKKAIVFHRQRRHLLSNICLVISLTTKEE